MDEQTTINTENEMKPPQPTITIYLHSENEIKNKKARIVLYTHTHKWRIETRREVKRNNIDSTANVVATKAHISFWDIETSLSFEIVG